MQLAEETSYGSRLSSLTQPHLMTMMENTFIDHFYLKSIREASIYMWTGGITREERENGKTRKTGETCDTGELR